MFERKLNHLDFFFVFRLWHSTRLLNGNTKMAKKKSVPFDFKFPTTKLHINDRRFERMHQDCQTFKWKLAEKVWNLGQYK